ncbi:MAG TPA: DUF2341 domain-containing protein [Polyangia bacterium]
MAAVVLGLLGAAPAAAAPASGGTLAWQRGDAQPGNQEPRAAVLDATGALILAGSTDAAGTRDYYTVKLAADGSGVAWRQTHDHAGGDDRATQVAVAPGGDVVVTGFVWNGASFDIHTIRHDGASGALKWQRTYDGAGHGEDLATAVVVDATGAVYVAGFGQSAAQGSADLVVLKYAADGTPAWVQTYDGPAHGHDRGYALAAAPDGVVVTGESHNGTDYDCVTIKLDAGGAQRWVRRRTSAGDDQCSQALVDAAGDVVVAGRALHGTNYDLFVEKLGGATGTLLWSFEHDGAYSEEPHRLATDASGNVIVAGHTFSVTSGDDLYLAQLDGQSGALRWSNTYNTGDGNGDTPVGLVVDAVGDVFVAGDTYDALAGNYDFVLVKYAGLTGTPVWEQRFDGGHDDRVAGLGLHPSGRVVVGGWSDRFTGGARDYDAWAVAYDPGTLDRPTGLAAAASGPTRVTLTWADNARNEDGFEIERRDLPGGAWTRLTTTGASVTSWVDATVTVSSDYTYRVRAIGAAGESDYSNEAYVTTATASFGAPAWTYVYDGADGGDDRVAAVAVGPDNHPVVTGSSFSQAGGFDYLTLKLDRQSAARLWLERHDGDQNDVDLACALAVDANNDVVVSGQSAMYSFPAGNTNDIYTLKYPAAGGAPLWGRQYNGPAAGDDRATAIQAVVGPGGVGYAVVGYGKNAAWNWDIYVLKYGATGVLEWAATPYDGGVLGDDVPAGAAFDDAGNVYVVGATKTAASVDWFVARYDGLTGARTWTDVFDGPGHGDDSARALAVRGGALYVTGRVRGAAGDDDLYLVKYDAASGARLWERAFANAAAGDDEGVGLGIDQVNGDVVVAGTTLAAPGNHDVVVLRYDSDGNRLWVKTLGRPAHDDITTAAALDQSGYLYVAADTNGGAGWDVLGVAFDERGNVVAGLTYGGPTGGEDRAIGVAANRLGEAFIAGHTAGAGGDFDYVVLKLRNPLLQVPAPLTATPAYTAITLGWGDNSSDEDGFKVERRDGACDAASAWQLVYTAGPNVTTWTDAGRPVGTPYCYRVTAFRNTGATSRPVLLATATPVPLAPAALTATASSTTTVDLAWTDSTTGEDGFRVQRCAGAGCVDFSDLATVGPEVITYRDASACQGSPYRYRVVAFRGGQWTSDPSSSAAVTTPAAVAPGGLTAARQTENRIDLTWTDGTSDETGFRVERCQGAGCASFAVVATLAPNTTAYSDSGLAPNTLYRYRVTAYKTAGCGWSVSSPVAEDTTTVLAPAGLAATVVDTTTIDLAWTDHTVSETGFEVWRCAGSGCASFALVATTAANAVGYRDAAVCRATTYRYQVRAVRTGSPAWSSPLSAPTADTTTPTPAPPGGLTATAQTEKRVDLAWTDATTDETLMSIQRCQGAGCTDFQEVATVAGPSTYRDLAVLPGTLYRYQVVATKTATCPWSAPSAVAEATTPSAMAPTGLTATAATATRIDLAWADHTSSETGFVVERCQGAGCTSFAQVALTGPDATTYSDTTVCHSQLYRYQVKAVNQGLSRGGGGCWTRRRAVQVSGYQPNDLIELQVAFDPAMQPNFNDLRFYDETTGLELGYWLKSKIDGVSATVWVQGGPTGAISLYYGNGAAASSSDPNRITLEFRDAFRGPTLDPTKWVEIDPDGSLGQNDDLLLTDVSDGWNKALISKQTFARAPQKTLYADLTIAADTPGNNHFMLGWEANQTTNPIYSLLVHALYWNNYLLSTYEKGGHTGPNTQPYAESTSYEMKVRLKTTGAQYYVRGGAYAGWTLVQDTSSYADATLRLGLAQYSHQARIHFLAVLPKDTVTATLGAPAIAACYAFGGTWETSYTNVAEATTPTPGPPGVLVATATSESRVALTWQDASSGETGFAVERCQGAGCTSFAAAGTAGPDTPSFTDSGLSAGTAYRYRVKAVSTASCPWETAYCNIADVTTPAPPEPINLTATAASTTELDLGWTDRTDTETLFRVQRCQGTGCADFADLATVAVNVVTYADATACAGTTYRYQVRAEGAGWQSAWSVPATGTATAAAAPSGVTATRLSEVAVRVTWTDTTQDESGFEVWRCAGAGCSDFALAGTVAANVRTFDDGAVAPETTYSYRVRAVKTAACAWSGPYGAAAAVTTSVTAPAGVGATPVNTTQVDLAWSDPTASESGFTIQRCTGSACDFSTAVSFEVPANTLVYSDTTACAAGSYRYRLRAHRDGGPIWVGPWSTVVGATTAGVPVPGAFAATAASDTEVALSWTDTASDEWGYRVERCSGSGCASFAAAGTAVANATSYRDGGLTPSAWYTYRVVAYKTATCGWESPSGAAAAQLAPARPGSLVATAQSSQAIRLDWADLAGDEDAFDLERQTANGAFIPWARVGAGATSFVDTVALEPSTTYHYRVTAVRGLAHSAYSNEAAATTPPWSAGDNTCH